MLRLLYCMHHTVMYMAQTGVHIVHCCVHCTLVYVLYSVVDVHQLL